MRSIRPCRFVKGVSEGRSLMGNMASTPVYVLIYRPVEEENHLCGNVKELDLHPQHLG